MTVNMALKWALGILNEIDVVCMTPQPNKQRTTHPHIIILLALTIFPPHLHTFHSFYCHLV